jgi:hypothetical protein
MQQGSVVSPITPQPPAETSRALVIQQQRVLTVKEVSSVLSAMQFMAMYCIDQSHVTLDHMEIVADGLGSVLRQIETLKIELASC